MFNVCIGHPNIQFWWEYHFVLPQVRSPSKNLSHDVDKINLGHLEAGRIFSNIRSTSWIIQHNQTLGKVRPAFFHFYLTLYILIRRFLSFFVSQL